MREQEGVIKVESVRDNSRNLASAYASIGSVFTIFGISASMSDSALIGIASNNQLAGFCFGAAILSSGVAVYKSSRAIT
ncbi:MAG: hypothetical protein ABIG28_01015 [archaeon]